ncbi:MAG: Mandelate racemase/muconate lactonizing enzyme [Proteobacteria bacterium]|nr:Mandelate racemase/muconate lactonizing enzyme [Pseudomonadota bacterium]
MNIVAADWLPYTLPLRSPWQTSQGTFSERSGRLLRLQTADGQTGWGDAAPLPAFGISEAAATAFADETAHLDLVAQKAGLPLHAWLSGNLPTTSIGTNANLGAISTVDQDTLKSAVDAGFSIIKIKLGLQAIAEEISSLQRLAQYLPPTLRLRLDANKAWKFADAQAFIKACAGLPIEGLEEPLAEPDPVSLAKLQSSASFPLGVDESIGLLDKHFFRHPPVRRIVIKPARQGGLLASIELALRARASSIEVIITSTLESACGLLACAHLAAAVAPDCIHGLATADWFSQDTGHAPSIIGGRLQLPGTAGLGFQPVSR